MQSVHHTGLPSRRSAAIFVNAPYDDYSGATNVFDDMAERYENSNF
jgi:hypothetical protein